MRYNASISFSKKFNDMCIGIDLNRNFDFQWGTGISQLDYFVPICGGAKYCDQRVCVSARISQKPPV